VGDVQGEERDTIYYSFVQDKKIGNADLRQIYPTIGGTADDIRKLKMQRLNVGFSRAKDTMVFVHSMEIGDYSDTRLGDALRHYQEQATQTHDHYIEDESVFDSPAERKLYQQVTQTRFFQENRDRIHLIAQFEIGRYIRREYQKYIPAYRVDFLLTYAPEAGREQSLILEYDGLEFHTKNPDIVNARNFDQEYLEYDIERQVELEGYGYRFLRIHKFSLLPTPEEPTPVDVLDLKLRKVFHL
jgi:very-short-patch-repair endonuclease